MLYAITDRQSYAESEADALARLLELAAIWAANGISYIQVREKDLSARDQVELVRAVIRAVRAVGGNSNTPKVLVNSRADVALATGAHGVHLPSGPDALTPEEVRSIFALAGETGLPAISVSCHTIEEVTSARKHSPDCILFAPVFEKQLARPGAIESEKSAAVLPGTGLKLLEQACREAAPVPVFALGGVTAENAADCIRAGAAGVAAIRLLQKDASAWKHLV
ncbi:MAG: thiamine phosphate synthase [Acidobacteriaceae bacterium]